MTDNPRAQAEQRLEIAFEMRAKYPVATEDLVAFAKLAAEEIAKVCAVVGHDDRDDCWLGAPGYPPVPEGHVHPHPPRPVPWHLVCADAESAKPEGGKRAMARDRGEGE